MYEAAIPFLFLRPPQNPGGTDAIAYFTQLI
jgi:hypothetical protein